jgi:molybdate transport system substrate-binding protein
MKHRVFLLVAAAVMSASVAAVAQPRDRLTLAAASDLQTVLPEITGRFERATGITTTLTFGSSGNFLAQIQNGAPFDLFLSADADYPRRLADGGYIDADTLYRYATGQLVLWTRNDSTFDVTQGLAILRDSRVRRIAIANPTVAPYGRAAVASIRSAGLFEEVEQKLVNAENVAQAAQLAQSGNADVAMIGHALALGPTLKRAGRFFEVPDRMHPPIVQAAGVVSASPNRDSARAFIDYLKGAEARRILRSYGFGVPDPANGRR